jgi:COMPASS component SWD2
MTSLEFSNNGKYILVGCATNAHYVLEAFTLQIVARLEGHVPLGFERKGVTRSGAEICWTPDSRYVLAGKRALDPCLEDRSFMPKFTSGDKDGKVCIWDLNPKTGNADLVPPIQPLPYEPGPRRPATTLPTLNVMNEKREAGESARVVKFNPRYAMFASAGADAVSRRSLSEEVGKLKFNPSGIMASEKRRTGGGRGHEYGLV